MNFIELYFYHFVLFNNFSVLKRSCYSAKEKMIVSAIGTFSLLRFGYQGRLGLPSCWQWQTFTLGL